MSHEFPLLERRLQMFRREIMSRSADAAPLSLMHRGIELQSLIVLRSADFRNAQTR
jgi:hypothetical protein